MGWREIERVKLIRPAGGMRARDRLVLMLLAGHAREETGLDVFPSRTTLARDAACTTTTVDKALKSLHAAGLIEPAGTRAVRIGRPVNIWHLNLPDLPNDYVDELDRPVSGKVDGINHTRVGESLEPNKTYPGKALSPTRVGHKDIPGYGRTKSEPKTNPKGEVESTTAAPGTSTTAQHDTTPAPGREDSSTRRRPLCDLDDGELYIRATSRCRRHLHDDDPTRCGDCKERRLLVEAERRARGLLDDPDDYRPDPVPPRAFSGPMTYSTATGRATAPLDPQQAVKRQERDRARGCTECKGSGDVQANWKYYADKDLPGHPFSLPCKHDEALNKAAYVQTLQSRALPLPHWSETFTDDQDDQDDDGPGAIPDHTTRRTA